MNNWPKERVLLYPFLQSISLFFITGIGCGPDINVIRPDWQQLEHAVCPHVIAEIPEPSTLVSVAGYEGESQGFWEVRELMKPGSSVLAINYRDLSGIKKTLSILPGDFSPATIVSTQLIADTIPNQAYLLVETHSEDFVYRLNPDIGIAAKNRFGKPCPKNILPCTRRLAWLEGGLYIFSVASYVSSDKVPVRLTRLDANLMESHNWSTSFCRRLDEEECEDDDDDDDDPTNTFSPSIVIPGYASPNSESDHLSLGIEIISTDPERTLILDSDHDKDDTSLVDSFRFDSPIRSDIHLLQYYFKEEELKYSLRHLFSNDSVTSAEIRNRSLVEVAHSQWATYVKASSYQNGDTADIVEIVKNSSSRNYFTTPFDAPSTLVQRQNGVIISGVSEDQFNYSRIKKDPETGSISIQFSQYQKLEVAGAGLVLLRSQNGPAELWSLNCSPQ